MCACFFCIEDLVPRSRVVETHGFLHALHSFSAVGEMCCVIDNIDCIASVGGTVYTMFLRKLMGRSDVCIFQTSNLDCLIDAVLSFMVQEAAVACCLGMAAWRRSSVRDLVEDGTRLEREERKVLPFRPVAPLQACLASSITTDAPGLVRNNWYAIHAPLIPLPMIT